MIHKIGVLGAAGRMGSRVCTAVADASDMRLVATVGRADSREPLADADVAVDFTHPDAAMSNLRWCLERGVDVIVGTSGFGEDRLSVIRSWLTDRPAARLLVVPNFSVGAVLMMRFAAQAARFYPSSEIIELHHPGKADAPSGTATAAATLITAAGEPTAPEPGQGATAHVAAGSRGAQVGHVRVHAVRLAGLLGHHRVLFGGHGETLTIQHDTLDRASFIPGVLLAIRQGRSLPAGLTVGLDSLLGLE